MKTLIENVALYRQDPGNVKLPWLFALLVLWVCGCAPEKKTEPAAPTTSAPATTVPLRVWFLAASEDKAVIERQWQANDDRSVVVTTMSAEELLSQSKPSCDVMVYPAWMLGELIARDWLTELPSKLQEATARTSEESDKATPAGWLEQARFHRKAWALSLAVQTPVIMANFELPKGKEVGPGEAATAAESIEYWHSVIAALKARSAQAPTEKPAPDELDAAAVCDRYLTILFSISDPVNNVGTLFQPDTLKPRVTDANFVMAGKIFQGLHQAGASQQSLLGSHSTAWVALANAAPTVTIALPPGPSAEVDKVNSITVAQPPNNPSKTGMKVTAGWNSGRGLMVSLSKQCRQTSTSIDFARWLSGTASQPGFANRIAGMNAASAFAPGSSAWQAQQIVSRLGAQTRLPSEPRLPRALEYRKVLGEQMAQAVRSEKTIEAALSDVDKAWQEITAQADVKKQSAAYLQSLGW